MRKADFVAARRRRRAGMAALAMLGTVWMGGCTAPKSASVAVVDPFPAYRPQPGRGELSTLPADDQQAVAVLLAHLQRLRGMNSEEMRREYLAANQSYARNRADENRLRLALALVSPNAAVRDDARAAGLLEGAVPERRGGPLGQFVALLQGMVSERSRQVHDEQRRAEALQQKLDALKAIEQSMSERDARNAATRSREPAKP